MAIVSGVESTVDYLEARCARLHAIVLEVAEQFAPLMEADMKASHTWQNVTGEAERQLRAYVDDLVTWIILWVESGVDYAAILETRDQGKYAILQKTVRKWHATILETIQARWQAELGAA